MWVVVFTVVFAGVVGPHVILAQCKTFACVAENLAIAQADPSVARVEVFKPGDYSPSPLTGEPMEPPVLDRWKS